MAAVGWKTILILPFKENSQPKPHEWTDVVHSDRRIFSQNITKYLDDRDTYVVGFGTKDWDIILNEELALSYKRNRVHCQIIFRWFDHVRMCMEHPNPTVIGTLKTWQFPNVALQFASEDQLVLGKLLTP